MSYICSLQVQTKDGWTIEEKEFTSEYNALIWGARQSVDREEVKYYEVYHS